MRYEKPIEYYKTRTELIDMLPFIKGRYLEIGCGDGGTLAYLKTKGASYVAGIDISKKAIDMASQKFLDFVLCVDVEKDILPFKEGEFDGIIFADVLEHLYNPWDTTKKIAKYLKDDGYMLLSIPNIKNYHILRRLIFHDEWSYSEWGILDNSHIRFFTLKEIINVLDYAGLNMIDLKLNASVGGIFKIVNTILCNKLDSFTVSQYYLLANKK